MKSPALISKGLLALAAGLLAGPASAAAPAADEPLRHFNQNPLVQVYGLPLMRQAGLLENGETDMAFLVDFSSHYISDNGSQERLVLDGETTRVAFTLAQGLPGGFEASIELPFVQHDAGFADSFIDNWHDFFSLSDGGRSDGPRDRFLFRYERNGQTLLNVDDEPSGLGDIRLGLGWQPELSARFDTSVHLTLDLPTGDADKLTGNESLDAAIWSVITLRDFLLPGLTGTAALGGLFTGEGEILADQRSTEAAFGWLALAYNWTPTVSTKLQLYSHSPLYEDSAFDALEGVAAQGMAAVGWRCAPQTVVDFGISEDLNTEASPDVTFHLTLRQGLN